MSLSRSNDQCAVANAKDVERSRMTSRSGWWGSGLCGIVDACASKECGRRLLPCLLLLLVAAAPGHADSSQPDHAKPKFGPHATSIQQSHEYLRTHRAPDY